MLEGIKMVKVDDSGLGESATAIGFPNIQYFWSCEVWKFSFKGRVRYVLTRNTPTRFLMFCTSEELSNYTLSW